MSKKNPLYGSAMVRFLIGEMGHSLSNLSYSMAPCSLQKPLLVNSFLTIKTQMKYE